MRIHTSHRDPRNLQSAGKLRAYIESIYVALSNPQRGMLTLADNFKGFPVEVIESTYADFKTRVPRDAAPSREGAETMLRELPALGVAVKSKNMADYIDGSLIEELRTEGFLDSKNNARMTERVPSRNLRSQGSGLYGPIVQFQLL